MKQRRLIPLLVLALLVPVTAVGAASPPAVSDGTGPLDRPADLAAAMRFEALIPHFTFYGMVTPLHYDSWPQVNPKAKPTNMVGEGDSGNYTGVYLAGQSWRYAQAKAELRKLGANPLDRGRGGSTAVRFWRGQRDEAAARVRQMVDYFHILVNIAKNWQTELEPKVDHSKNYDEFGWLSYGGGVIPGEAGLLMRTCTPEKAVSKVADLRTNFAPTGELIGPLPFDDGKNYFCIGSTSRDSYAGTIFGLSVALDFFATEENPKQRELLSGDLMAITDYALKYLWFQPRPHGTVANPVFGHNDLKGPVSPLFQQVPGHRLNMLKTARRGAELLGDTAKLQRYDVLYQAELAVSLWQVAGSQFVDSQTPHDAYYKFQLNLMSLFNLVRLETDPLVREEILRAIGVADASLTDDGNAFFEAMVYALTREPDRLAEAVSLNRQWLDYHAFHDYNARRGVTPFIHAVRCDITTDPGPSAPLEKRPLECLPKDQTDMMVTLPTGERQELPFKPGTEGVRAKHPLPVGVRRLADFLWQKDPTVATGDHVTPWRGPSIDFLATYWMLRYYSEVEPPGTPNPLPVWSGPTFH